MDLIREVVSTPYAFPAGIVVLVISCAILVFVFGFKSAEEPSFDELSFSNEDRKPAGKKRKLKDKKSQSNGHALSVKEKPSRATSEEASKTNKQSLKESPKEVTKKRDQPKEKKQDTSSVVKKSASTTPKQSASKKSGKDAQEIIKNFEKQEKIDDDDGWEQVGKKNRKGSPQASEEKTPISPKKEKITKKAAAEKTVETKNVSLTLKEDAKDEKVDTLKQEDSNIKVVATKENTKSLDKKKEEIKKVQEELNLLEPKAEDKKEKKKKPVVETVTIAPSSNSLDDAEASSEKKIEGAVFDELGDVWTEKVPKKSKKKVRKE